MMGSFPMKMIQIFIIAKNALQSAKSVIIWINAQFVPLVSY